MTSETLAAPDCNPSLSPHGGATWERLLSAVVACQESGDLPKGDPTVFGSLSLVPRPRSRRACGQTGPLRYMPQAKGGLEPLAREVLGAAMSSLRLAAAREEER